VVGLLMFAVVRHPEAGIGTAPDEALPHMQANGWVRVSEFRSEPGDFHLPDYADAPEFPAELDEFAGRAQVGDYERVLAASKTSTESEPAAPADNTEETEA